MSEAIQFLISDREAGIRVDEFCASRYGNLSRMRIARLIEDGFCLVNGVTARAGARLIAGDVVETSFKVESPTSMHAERIPLEILFEDQHILVVVKPAGTLVHPTLGVKTGTLLNALAHHLNIAPPQGEAIVDGLLQSSDTTSSIPDDGAPQEEARPVVRPGLVHRLDRATSGVMVIAKTPRSLSILSKHFRKRLVSKRYMAIVEGLIAADAGAIHAPIARDPNLQPRWRVMESGKPAETGFTVLERRRRTTLVELAPVTGRTNQLRIHFAYFGHPIIGDVLYGTNQFAGENTVKCKTPFQTRLCLHAWRLAFHHPSTGEWLEFSSTPPADFWESGASCDS